MEHGYIISGRHINTAFLYRSGQEVISFPYQVSADEEITKDLEIWHAVYIPTDKQRMANGINFTEWVFLKNIMPDGVSVDADSEMSSSDQIQFDSEIMDDDTKSKIIELGTKRVLLRGGFDDGAYSEIMGNPDKLFRNEGKFNPMDPKTSMDNMKASLYVKTEETQDGIEIFNFVKANIPFSEWDQY